MLILIINKYNINIPNEDIDNAIIFIQDNINIL